jgi:hypothetical protein
VPLAALFEEPTPRAMAAAVAAAEPVADDWSALADVDDLLAEIDQLSDDEARAVLGDLYPTTSGEKGNDDDAYLRP